MCGICGFNWEDKKTIKEMTEIFSYRGPDQYDYYTDNLISLGHRRLNIIDLSERGKQPLCNEQGTIWLTYNGEIYNFKEIKRDLEKKGHIFKSNTDSEVIIHAYEEYGIECVKIFNGMFAFAIWDSRKKKIILARDRLGIKPLFYYFNRSNNKFIFASEMKSICSNPEINREINKSSFNQILHYGYLINKETLIKDVHELRSGHFLEYNFNELKIERYWEIPSTLQYPNENFFIKKMRKLLRESVERRLVADVPLGASLSGGLDSSSIVAMMSQLKETPVETFTVGFNDESDEFNEAKKVAEFCKTNHHEKIISFESISKNLPKILWHMETPFAKPAVFATYFLSQEINKNKIIIDLSGEGSDEIFGGYNRYDVYLDKTISNKDKSRKIVSSYFPEEEIKEKFFNKDILSNCESFSNPENILQPMLEKKHKKEHLNAALHFELKNQLSQIQLTRVDRMSMANSHEIRVPFLDHKFVEFGMSIPSSFKWKDTKKYILQKAMEPFLPKEITYRTKIPFHIPLQKYFQEEFIGIASNILDNSIISKKGFAKQNQITEMIRKIRSKEVTDDESLRQILFLTNFELFYKIFIESDKVERINFNLNNFL